MRAATALAVLALAASASAAEPAHRLRSDDPITVDRDNLPTARPEEQDVDDYYDGLENLFGRPGEERVPLALNVNTLGEVPDSSWFTNRMSEGVMSVEELVRGPNRGDGPDMSEPWTVIDLKHEGVTPGFRIRDARGDVYFIKLDPLYWPQLATSTEVVGTKFFHAFGYHVPEN